MALGEQLRKARLARKETTSQVAVATRIMVQQVEALEREDFSRIPAAIYGKGFIRLYAEHVGLDPQPLIAEYMARFAGPKVPSLEPEQIVAATPEERDAEAPAARPGRREEPAAADAAAPPPRPESKRSEPAAAERKPKARKMDRPFAEPDLFSRVGMPSTGVSPASAEPQAQLALDVSAPAAKSPAAQVSPSPTAAAEPPPPAAPQPLKLEAEGAVAAGVGRVRPVLGIDAAAEWARRWGRRAARWARDFAAWTNKKLEDFSFAQLLKSPAKMAVLAAVVLLIVVFIVSGLSRLFGPRAEREAAPLRTPRELQLTVDPPAPYFESNGGK